MGKILIGMIVLGVLLVIFFSAVDSGLSKQAQVEYARGQAESMVIRAQAESALSHAQASQAQAIAFSMTMMTLVPWGVLFTVSLLGLGVLALCFTLAYFRHTERQSYPPQIVYLPNPSLPRREVWNALANTPQNGQIVSVPRAIHYQE